MIQLLALKRGKSLESFLSQFPTKTFATEEEYTWDVVGNSRRNIPLVECRDENGEVVTSSSTTNVGAGTAPFELVFAEDWFADGSIQLNLLSYCRHSLVINYKKNGQNR